MNAFGLEGRIAYLYDTIGHLDQSRSAFALGLWIEDPHSRVERFAALASVAASAFPEWHLNQVPFSRPLHDLLSLFSRVQVAATSAPELLDRRPMWTSVFSGPDTPVYEAMRRRFFAEE